jgi:cbb3-type cytochrome oxidase subunit 3
MKAEVLSQTNLVFLAEISVALFFGVFIGSFFWAYRKGAKAEYDRRAFMPLDDGQPVEGGAAHGA